MKNDNFDFSLVDNLCDRCLNKRFCQHRTRPDKDHKKTTSCNMFSERVKKNG